MFKSLTLYFIIPKTLTKLLTSFGLAANPQHSTLPSTMSPLCHCGGGIDGGIARVACFTTLRRRWLKGTNTFTYAASQPGSPTWHVSTPKDIKM